MLRAMSIGDWFRRLFSSGRHSGDGDPANSEDLETVDEHRVEIGLEQESAGLTEGSAGGMGPGRPGTPAATEAAQAEIASQEPPPHSGV
jgi:hypothetical protein